ncbi:MAG TPA: hypothetical protein ENJ09_13920 [Planctomycetes bacterium]|nr:hypothetical protein [Planctomycetota bacterium]
METHARAGFGSLFEGGGTSPARIALGLIVGILCFVALSEAVGAGLARLLGPRLAEDGMAAIKARHMAEHGDDYDVLFVGSSRVYRQIRPRVFDAECERAGAEVRSYNLGLAGMRFFEALRTAEALLSDPPASLDVLVLEGLDPDPRLREENLLSRREIAWHTPGLTWLALRRVWRRDEPLAEKLRETRGHLFQFGCSFANVGTASALSDLLFGGPGPEEDRTPGGYLPLEKDPSETVTDRRRAFLEALNENRSLLEERVAELEAEPRSVEPDALFADTLARLEGIAREAGVELVFVVLPPVEHRRPELVGAKERGCIEHLADLSDPAEHPDFYLKLAERFDENHLKKNGAARLTKLVAAAVASVLEGAQTR